VSSERNRPQGVGLGDCPQWEARGWGRRTFVHCGCYDKCAVCGHEKHSGVHMICMHEGPSGPPWGHQFISTKDPS
jgi:hypothetical protein